MSRRRRTKADIEVLREAIYTALEEDRPMTVRQVFYRLVSMGAIAKSENEYKNTICRLLVDMRRDGTVPYGWIADSTRWMRKLTTYSSLQDALLQTAQTYRRSLWNDIPAYVEVWLEKDALAGVLTEETYQWDISLMVTRGYPSLSYLYEAASNIAARGVTAYLYYFGDYDPSGVDIPRVVQQELSKLAPEADIRFERVAVNPEQIDLYGLETRPTKKSDSRSKNFKGESVEVDAIPPKQLRKLARNCIEQHVSWYELEMLQTIEEQERRTLENLARHLNGWDD